MNLNDVIELAAKDIEQPLVIQVLYETAEILEQLIQVADPQLKATPALRKQALAKARELLGEEEDLSFVPPTIPDTKPLSPIEGETVTFVV